MTQNIHAIKHSRNSDMKHNRIDMFIMSW